MAETRETPPSALRCALIGSGSAGNATLVAGGATTLLIDCGYSIRAFEERLQDLALEPSALTAILVTHEHDDHVGGVDALARRHGIPVFATRGTRAACEVRGGPLPHWHEIPAQAPFQVGDIEVRPIPVPHDARQPSQFIFRAGESSLGVLTDVGSLTPHVVAEYRACRTLVLEFNHDPELLAASAYPARLKKRIAGAYGHFSNAQAQALLRAMQSTTLRHVVAAHLSERTNRPDIVAGCLEASARETTAFGWSIAAQDRVLPWREV
ncbi:MAG: MBL fold metallo-hydrolase [Gammaproteobacteria bacterium]